ncbi:hypothetical protein G9A89_021020 [Geosiphon pyriformis]|nr:hypothetical protein G9A89_021020 [Geosiphon pyriformis]
MSMFFSRNTVLDAGNILLLGQFFNVKDDLLEVWSNFISVFTDGSLKGLGSVDVARDTAAFFSEIELGIGIRIVSLLSLTMAKLQAVALALECVPSFCSVKMNLNSQAALDACVSELKIGSSDFHNCCWMEKRHIANLVKCKNISVTWLKVKKHSGVLGNVCADELASVSAHSSLMLLINVHERFLVANNMPISGNIQHFI